MNYTPPNDVIPTFNNLGGYQINLDGDRQIADKLIDSIDRVDWLYYGLAMFTVDFVVFNPNYNRYVYTYVAFLIDGSG